MKKKIPRIASLKTIAEEAGVSLMTASRAINETGYVARETKEKIKVISDKYKYRPNLLIRGVQTGRTMNIGVVFPVELDFYGQVLEGIHDELLRNNYSIQLSLVHNNMGPSAVRQEQSQLMRLLDMRVDGIILRAVNDQASDLYFREVFERNIPLIIIDRRLENVRCNYVGTNDYESGQRAANYLISKGHRNILLVATGDMISTGRDRRDGFVEYAKSVKGIQITVINENDFKYHDESSKKALANHPEITAAFCVKDSLAAGLYKTAGELGRKIPEDLSVLGFGNLELCALISPSLSTFDQHPVELGRNAASQLLKRIHSEKAQVGSINKIIPAELIERQSVIDAGCENKTHDEKKMNLIRRE